LVVWLSPRWGREEFRPASGWWEVGGCAGGCGWWWVVGG